MKKTNAKRSYIQQREDNLMEWVGFWRKNPHLFARDYLGLSLKLYQKILLYMIEKNNLFMYIAARGLYAPNPKNRNIP